MAGFVYVGRDAEGNRTNEPVEEAQVRELLSHSTNIEEAIRMLRQNPGGMMMTNDRGYVKYVN